MTRLPRVTAREVLAALGRDGWQVARQQGSHITLHHPSRAGSVTVAAHAGETIRPRTLNSILKQAGLTVDAFRRLL